MRPSASRTAAPLAAATGLSAAAARRRVLRIGVAAVALGEAPDALGEGDVEEDRPVPPARQLVTVEEEPFDDDDALVRDQLGGHVHRCVGPVV